MKRRAIIILNANLADFNSLSKYISKDDFIIAADGGVNYLNRLKIKPDVVIGDFDSSIPGKIPDAEYIGFFKEKNLTDSELALDYAVKKNYSEIIIYGLLGDRIDHFLANILLLTKKKYKNVNIKIIESKQEIYMSKGDIVINGSVGDIVSLIPIAGKVIVSSSSGLKYDPSKYQMSSEFNVGISNELIKLKAEVKIKNGRFLVIKHMLS